MNRKAEGFSLIELIIVVAIIGILVAIALPQYQNYQLRTKVVEALVMVERVKTAIEVYHQAHGRWPANNEEAGLPHPKDVSSDYVQSTKIIAGGDPACGIIALRLTGNRATSDDPMGLGVLAGTYMWFAPKEPDSEETIEWYCGIPNLKKNQSLVPKECRNPRKKSC